MKKRHLMFLCAFLMCTISFTSCVKEEEEDRNDPTQHTDDPGAQDPDTAQVGSKQFSVNGVDFDMVLVEHGTFQMGASDEYVEDDEMPVHSVTLTNDYFIGNTEVTQKLWKAVMGSNPSYFEGDNRPVEQVNWNDVQAFLTKLNQLTGKSFRLPTEAEWEYAARGGKHSKGYLYSGSNTVDEVAWYNDSLTHDVGMKKPNELGLYDMSGNVYEWCQDWYGEDYYSISPSTNPTGPASGLYYILRGGSWSSLARYNRSTYRDYSRPTSKFHFCGVRLALTR